MAKNGKSGINGLPGLFPVLFDGRAMYFVLKKMAKQEGPFFITGIIGPVCFYRLCEKYYVRTKSSLSGVRVKKDPAFAKTMAYAGLLKEASLLASSVYRALSDDKRQHALYRQLTGTAMRLLKEGKSIAETRELLNRLC